MATLLKLANWVERLVIRIGELAAWLIIPLIAVIMYDVVSRKFQFVQQWVLSTPLYDFISPTKLQELEWHLHAVLFLLVFGYGYFRNVHVRIDLIREGLSTRKQAWVELSGLIVFALPYLLVMTYVGWFFVTKSFWQGEGSDALTGIPHRWVIKSFLLFGLVLLLGAILSTIIRLVAFLFGVPDTSAAAHARLSVIPKLYGAQKNND